MSGAAPDCPSVSLVDPIENPDAWRAEVRAALNTLLKEAFFGGDAGDGLVTGVALRTIKDKVEEAALSYVKLKSPAQSPGGDWNRAQLCRIALEEIGFDFIATRLPFAKSRTMHFVATGPLELRLSGLCATDQWDWARAHIIPHLAKLKKGRSEDLILPLVAGLAARNWHQGGRAYLFGVAKSPRFRVLPPNNLPSRVIRAAMVDMPDDPSVTDLLAAVLSNDSDPGLLFSHLTACPRHVGRLGVKALQRAGVAGRAATNCGAMHLGDETQFGTLSDLLNALPVGDHTLVNLLVLSIVSWKGLAGFSLLTERGAWEAAMRNGSIDQITLKACYCADPEKIETAFRGGGRLPRPVGGYQMSDATISIVRRAANSAGVRNLSRS